MGNRFWKEISEAASSDDVILSVKYMLHEIFDAEYVVVYIAPEHISRKIEADFNLRFEFVSKNYTVPKPVEEKIRGERKRFLPANRVTEEVIKKFNELGALPTTGYYSIIKNIFVENTYIGFIAIYRKQNFSSSEKRKLTLLKPFLTMSLRMATYLALLEEFDTYFFEHILNATARRYKLTPSEISVLRNILQGRSMKEIAKSRGTSVHAVKKLMKSLYRKMNISNRAELVPKLLFRNRNE